MKTIKTLGILFGTGLVALLFAGASGAQSFKTVRYASGLDRPVYLTAPPDDIGRVFVLEAHTGQIRILRLATRTLEPTPFLTVPGVATGDEQGLLGLAFHPDYASNGYFYVNYTDPDTRIVRYQVSADPDIANPASATPVLSIPQPQSNHNGGWLGFGADGYLYISTGDGGAGDDSGTGHIEPGGNAQNLDTLLGKILRIDVDGDAFPGDAGRNYAIPPTNPFAGRAGADEIWVYGLRNPWRISFDRLNQDLYIGDVGQTRCEELDVQPGSSAGGENYGWRLREGVIATPGSVGGAPPAGAINPIFDYPHAGTGELCSGPPAGFTGVAITGGYVYRGPITSLAGRYFFADFATGRLWSLRYDGSNPSTFDGGNYTQLTDHTGQPSFTPDVSAINSVSSFGEDAAGNLYVVDLGGEVFYIPEAPAAWMQLVGIGATAALARRRARA